MPAATIYAAKRVQLTYGEIAITGLAEGTFVKVARNKEAFAVIVGLDGDDTATVLEGDDSGYVEFTLHQASPANALLMAKANAQIAAAVAGTPLPRPAATVRDKNGNFLGECSGYLAKPADTEYAGQTTSRTWKVISGKVSMSGGGVTESKAVGGGQ